MISNIIVSINSMSKGKSGKEKIPNAYEVNPRLMDELAQITP